MSQAKTRAFLLTWNSDERNWEDRKDDVKKMRMGRLRKFWWSTGHSQQIDKGARVFIMKQAREPRGIIGMGRTSSSWQRDENIRGNLIAKRPRTGVRCTLDFLLDPGEQKILLYAALLNIDGDGSIWNTQSSGRSIPPETAELLEVAFLRFVGGHPDGPVKLDEDALAEEVAALEGEPRDMIVRHRKREAWKRKEKIDAVLAATGCVACEVLGCGFNFERTYGRLGRHYAHVHHRKGLSDPTRPSETRLKDLAIVCANCHAMIHKGGRCRRLQDVMPKAVGRM